MNLAQPVQRGNRHEGAQPPRIVEQQPDACQRSAPTTELLAKVFKGRQSPPAALEACLRGASSRSGICRTARAG